MLLMEKYLFSTSKAAVAPPRRQETTAAPGLPANLFPAEKNSLSRKASSVPFGEAKYTGEPITRPSNSSARSASRFTPSSKTHLPVFAQLRQPMQP